MRRRIDIDGIGAWVWIATLAAFFLTPLVVAKLTKGLAMDEHRNEPAHLSECAKSGVCPFCGSENIDGGSFDVDWPEVSQECSCADCDSVWTFRFGADRVIDTSTGEAFALSGAERPTVYVIVQGGLVQDIMATSPVDVEVLDLDGDDFATDEEIEQAEALKKRADAIANNESLIQVF